MNALRRLVLMAAGLEMMAGLVGFAMRGPEGAAAVLPIFIPRLPRR